MIKRIIDTPWKYGRAPGVLAGEVVRVDAAEHELATGRAGRVAVEPEGKDGRRDQALVHCVLERRPRAAHRDLRKRQALRAPPQALGAEGALEKARNAGDNVTCDADRVPPKMISHEAVVQRAPRPRWLSGHSGTVSRLRACSKLETP